MPNINMEEVRAKAIAQKGAAKQNIISAKREAEERKKLKANPPPVYVELPDQTGNAEIDSLADLGAVADGFRKRAKDESTRFELAVDTEYWACLCFQTREQKEVFLAALNLLQFGNKYIDGQLAAKELGIKLPDGNVPYNTSAKIDKRFAKFIK